MSEPERGYWRCRIIEKPRIGCMTSIALTTTFAECITRCEKRHICPVRPRHLVALRWRATAGKARTDSVDRAKSRDQPTEDSVVPPGGNRLYPECEVRSGY